jgi:hypothetical protein
VLLAERLPGRSEFGGLVTNLLGEAVRAGVVLHRGVTVDAERVRLERPDVVVVATGAVPYRPELELMDDPVVLDAWQVLSGEVMPSGAVVVADWRGDWIGLGVARRLAEAGHRVTLAVNAPHAGYRLQQYLRVAGVAALVLAQGHLPVHRLLDELADYSGEVRAVGDCLSPRTAEEAVLEGLEVGSSI